jgi:hypothetical protein
MTDRLRARPVAPPRLRARSHGFEVTSEARIPGDVPNWFMERAAR